MEQIGPNKKRINDYRNKRNDRVVYCRCSFSSLTAKLHVESNLQSVFTLVLLLSPAAVVLICQRAINGRRQLINYNFNFNFNFHN